MVLIYLVANVKGCGQKMNGGVLKLHVAEAPQSVVLSFQLVPVLKESY